MNETLKALYDSFHTPLALAEEKQEIKDCHQQLIERLEKPERKLVLRIIDAKDRTTELLSIDSFEAGFQLAWRLANELNIREKQHPSATRKSVRSDAAAISEETEGGNETWLLSTMMHKFVCRLRVNGVSRQFLDHINTHTPTVPVGTLGNTVVKEF